MPDGVFPLPEGLEASRRHPGRIYVINLHDRNNSITVNEMTVAEGFPQAGDGALEYAILHGEAVLETGHFDDPLLLVRQLHPPLGEDITPIEEVPTFEADFTLMLPYYYHATAIRLSKPSQVLLTIDVGPLRDDDEDDIRNPEDNCPLVVNPQQEDEDGDGAGAACDCDDRNPEISPLQQEECSTTIDDDCDSVVNDGCRRGGSPVLKKAIMDSI